jgi:hypothetical protein
MSYELEQRIDRLSRFNIEGNKSLQIDFKQHGMQFFGYIQNAENELLEWRYDVLFEGCNLLIKLIINTNHNQSFTQPEKQMDLFRYLD